MTRPERRGFKLGEPGVPGQGRNAVAGACRCGSKLPMAFRAAHVETEAALADPEICRRRRVLDTIQPLTAIGRHNQTAVFLSVKNSAAPAENSSGRENKVRVVGEPAGAFDVAPPDNEVDSPPPMEMCFSNRLHRSEIL